VPSVTGITFSTTGMGVYLILCTDGR
jgi:hypothetical protein